MIDFMISEIRKHNGKRSYSCASYYLELEVLTSTARFCSSVDSELLLGRS